MPRLPVFCFWTSLLMSSVVLAHDGPDPLARWRCDAASVEKNGQVTLLKARLGPQGKVVGAHAMLTDNDAEALFLKGGECGVVLAENFVDAKRFLPQESLTVSAWVSVDKPLPWGGLLGVIQDNGDSEFGWLLGYNESRFSFALRGKQGPGKLTYLSGKTEYKPGRLYHLVAVYDGKTMQLYVDGKLDAESREQSGPVVYPDSSSWMLGAYRDDNEFHGHRGRIYEIALYGVAAKPAWVKHDFDHNAGLTRLPAVKLQEPLHFVIHPYLQFATKTGMTVMWRTNKSGESILHYGETAECRESIATDEAATLHEIRLTELTPETQYFYRTETRVAGETSLISKVSTFQTAVRRETPFAFAVISDTQGNPTVSGKLAEHAWGQRPSFLLHPGDLVSTGKNDSHWTQHFFPSMNSLIRHVPFYPVLGNHEQNARNYFDYVSLPKPEYYYEFQFGNTHFFMIDSNRNVAPDSEQYQWLDTALEKSNATWKIVCHHHPPYSSDENDYGNLWKTNKSTRGDHRVRQLVPLYEKHNVDIVWNGHIHSYERTWPLKGNKAVESDGPIYMITGGGGGPLETPGPVRPFFQNTVRRGHHYSMVRVNGQKLELQVYDMENRLFDQMTIDKRIRK